jgi:Tfp pilus assembly protein PilO
MKSILSITVIAICVGMYFMYIKPLTVEIKTKIAEKSEYTKVLTRVKQIKEKREAVLADYNSISPDEIDRLNKIIPEKVEAVPMLNNLSAIGERYGVLIKDFKVAETDPASHDVTGASSIGGHKTTAITIHLTGSYEQFLNFLEDVEYSLSLIDVTSLNIIPGALSKTGQAGLMEFALEANTYSLR